MPVAGVIVPGYSEAIVTYNEAVTDINPFQFTFRSSDGHQYQGIALLSGDSTTTIELAVDLIAGLGTPLTMDVSDAAVEAVGTGLASPAVTGFAITEG